MRVRGGCVTCRGFTITIVITAAFQGILGLKLSAEKHLINDLLEQYSRVTVHGRPVLNNSDPVHVRFGLGLIQIELDEQEKALSLSLWSKYVWEDDYLQWNPLDYGNILSIKLPSRLIWLPDIMLYNTAETEVSARDTLATVFHNGTVMWTPHQKLKSSCSIDVTNFPFDCQQCHMWFGSWTYTTRDINLTMPFHPSLDLSTFHTDFKDTSQWAITDARAERRVLPSVDVEPNFSVLTYTLGLKRNLVFASYILTLPCVFLACLTLVVFWLPPDRPDRTALAMSIFSSFLLLLLILVEAAPPTASSVPSLGIYYCFNMVIIMMAVFLSSLVVNVCKVGDTGRPVPRWIRKVTMEGPVRYICMCNGLLPIGDFYRQWSKTADQSTHRSQPCKKNMNVSMAMEDRSFLCSSETLLQGSETILLRDLSRCHNQLGTGGMLDGPCYENDQLGTPGVDSLRNNTPDGATNHQRHNARGATERKAAQTSPRGLPLDGEELLHRLQCMGQSVRQLENYFYTRTCEEQGWHCARKEWRNVAYVLDRIFFLLYVCLILLSVTILFPRPN